MSEIVSRLRAPIEIEYAVPLPVCEVLQRAADERGEAADEIERLRERLSAALAEGREHWSDCAVYAAPAYEPMPCNCGGRNIGDAETSAPPSPDKV